MESVKINWKDFSDGRGANAEVCLRLLIGDKYGNDEVYFKSYLFFAIGKRVDDTWYLVFDGGGTNEERIVLESAAGSLQDAKNESLHHLAPRLAKAWLSHIFTTAIQSSSPAGF